ncbi:MAG: DUF4163 domain-containing protein [Lachnospiraceae bacterium]|nr:DUF4163 domain-containing protein [Lachnospiraceae bacterium]
MKKISRALAIALTASVLLTGCGLTDAMAEIISEKLQENLGTEETTDTTQATDVIGTDPEEPEVSKPGTQEPETVEEELEAEVQGADPELVVMNKYDYEMSDDNEYNMLLTCTIRVPALSDDSAKIYPELAASLKDLADKELENFDETKILLYEETSKEYELYEDHDAWDAYETNSDVTVKRADPQVVSLFFPFNNYYGGAHGIYGNGCATFDTKTGQRLHLTDVLESTDDLNSIVIKDIRRQYGDDLDMFEDLDESLGHYSAEVEADESYEYPVGYTWALTPLGLEIYFGPYELATYAMGDQTVLLRYEDYPDLFVDKYVPKDKNAGFIECFNRYTDKFDVDGDGENDAIGVDPVWDTEYNEYVNAQVYINDKVVMVGEDDYDVAFPEDAKGYYVRTEDGGSYMYLVCATYSDYYDIYVYDLSSGKPEQKGYLCSPSFYIDYDYDTSISRSFFLYDPDNMHFADRFDVITTFNAFKTYHVGRNGMPETDDEVYTIYNTGGWEPVKCIQPFEATYVNENGEEEPITINRGETFEFTATDGKTYVDTVISDGTPVRLYYELRGYDLRINGYPAEDIFKELMYSG